MLLTWTAPETGKKLHVELEPGALLLHPLATLRLIWRYWKAFKEANEGKPATLEGLLGDAVAEGLDVEYNGRRY